jgi:hypothetical protein
MFASKSSSTNEADDHKNNEADNSNEADENNEYARQSESQAMRMSGDADASDADLIQWRCWPVAYE